MVYKSLQKVFLLLKYIFQCLKNPSCGHMANVFVQIIASKKVRLKITQNMLKKIFFNTETQRHNASLQFRKFKRFPRLYIADSKDYVHDKSQY